MTRKHYFILKCEPSPHNPTFQTLKFPAVASSSSHRILPLLELLPSPPLVAAPPPVAVPPTGAAPPPFAVPPPVGAPPLIAPNRPGGKIGNRSSTQFLPDQEKEERD
ncbi:hypothetical protein R6Q59_029062 [Mikania micrantha]